MTHTTRKVGTSFYLNSKSGMLDSDPTCDAAARQDATLAQVSISDRDALMLRNHRLHDRARSVIPALTLTMILWAASGTSCAAAEPDTIRVTIQPTVTALPLVVADKKGMFAKRGIVSKWTVAQVPISNSISTLGRQFDVMTGTYPALTAASGQGIPVVLITGGALDTPKVPTSNIIARSDNGIRTFKQLEGKTVGALTLAGSIHFALLNVLQKQGVDLDSIHWVVATEPQLPDLLRAGRVDAIEEIEPFASAAISAGGIALGDPLREIGDRAYIGVWLSERSWADNNKDLILRYAQSMDEGADWISSNTDEAKTILGSYTGFQGPALETIVIPEFHFSTSAADLSSQQTPHLETWVDILKRTSDFKPVKPDDLLPSWAK
jgi:NitT/TauT family transport system substrate-binding protein